MHKLLNVPSILKEFDPTLTARERGRVLKHSTTYQAIRTNVLKHNTEREVQVFLYHELTRPEPREYVIDRLCGMLHRFEARRKRAELTKFAKLPARKRY